MFENKGCQILLVVIGVVTAVGFLLPLAMTGYMGPQANEPGAVEVVRVGDSVVMLGPLSQRLQEQEQREAQQAAQFGMPVTMTPDRKLRALQTTLYDAVEGTYQVMLAKRLGIAMDETSLVQSAGEQLDEQLKMAREQLKAGGLVKADATEAEVTAKLKEQLGGRDPADIRKEALAEATKALGQKERRDLVVAELVRPKLMKHFEGKVAMTEAQAKAQFDKLEVQVLPVRGEGADEKAEQLAQQLRGGAKFEDVAKANGQAESKPSEVRRTDFLFQKDLAPLGEMKPGDVKVVTVGGIPNVYKLLSVKNEVPPDWDQNKAQFIQQFKQIEAGQLQSKALEDLKKEVPAQWKLKGYEVAYRLIEAEQEAMGDPAKMKAATKEIYEEANALIDSEPTTSNVTELVRYVAFNTYYGMLTATEQKELLAERAEFTSAVLNQFESFTLRNELYRMLLDLNRPEDAAAQLLEAARNNTDYQTEGQQVHKQIGDLVASAEKDKKLPADTIAEIRKELDRWTKEKVQFDKDEAEIKAEQAKLDKELEEEAKRLAAEDAKELADQGKADAAKALTEGAGQPKSEEAKSGNK